MPYPERLEDVSRLVEQHKHLDHQKLLLAIYYSVVGEQNNVHLMEVITPFGYNEVNEDKELFEMQYGSTPGFSLPAGSHLNILLTNPVEAKDAIEQEWSAMVPVIHAVRHGNYQVIYKEAEASDILDELRNTRSAA